MGEKIQETIKQYTSNLLEFWNKYTSKQKTIIISVIAVVVFALVILIWVFSRTNYVTIASFETTKEAAEATNLLKENGTIKYRVSDDALTISVAEDQVSSARLILGENGVTSEAKEDYTFLFNNSFSTTDSERRLKEKIQLQNTLAQDIKSIDGIKAASVRIQLPDTSHSVYKENTEAEASILVTTTSQLSSDSIVGIANYVANSLGNKNTDNIRIIDQSGELLFEGGDANSVGASAGNTAKVTEYVTGSIEKRIRGLLVDSGVYDDATVMSNLKIQLDEQEILDTMYYSNDDDDTGPKNSYYIYNAENADGNGGIVGTDSNDSEITDYNLYDNTYGNSTVQVIREGYDTSSTVTSTKKAVGAIDTSSSTVSIILNKYVYYDEAKMKEQGLLEDGTTFVQFEAENSEPKQIEVAEEMYGIVQNATGIKKNGISILAYEVPVFYPIEKAGVEINNILPIIMAVLIAALLIFVVFKGMKPVEVTEMEPELSVEALLATTKESQSLDDIEFSEKSATRQQIEKFVDENPEAVASLLRNWLNEDWE